MADDMSDQRKVFSIIIVMPHQTHSGAARLQVVDINDRVIAEVFFGPDPLKRLQIVVADILDSIKQ